MISLKKKQFQIIFHCSLDYIYRSVDSFWNGKYVYLNLKRHTMQESLSYTQDKKTQTFYFNAQPKSCFKNLQFILDNNQTNL